MAIPSIAISTNAYNLSTAATTKQTIYLKNDYNLFCFHESLDNELYQQLKVIQCFVNPVFALFGTVMNITCMAILRRSGLRKPSNILLLALVIGDSLNIVTDVNFGEILRYFGPDKTKPGYCTWEYDAPMNYFLYVCKEIYYFLGLWGHEINAIIPIIITVERLLAVFFPVTFKKVVTVKSVLLCCLVTYIFWLPWLVFITFTGRLFYVRISNDKFVAMDVATDLLVKNINFIYIFIVYVQETLSSYLPTVFIVIGCILIGIRIKTTLRSRSKLTDGKLRQQWSPRTTRTLLVSCLIFALAHTANTLISQLVIAGSNSPIITYLLMQVAEFINLLQCSSNFLVYIATNRKLWSIFLQIIKIKDNHLKK